MKKKKTETQEEDEEEEEEEYKKKSIYKHRIIRRNINQIHKRIETRSGRGQIIMTMGNQHKETPEAHNDKKNQENNMRTKNNKER